MIKMLESLSQVFDGIIKWDFYIGENNSSLIKDTVCI